MWFAVYYSFTHLIFMDDLLHARHYSQSWEYGIVQNSECVLVVGVRL